MRNNPSDSVDGFLGYANQIYRGLGYLIDKLSTVLIEKDDDVVVSDDYGYLFLEQVKEKEKVIFRVTAPDFLKTLKNWVNLYINKKDKFNERTKCILTLVCRNEVDDDLILFNNAKNMEDCEEAYHKLIQRIKNIKDIHYCFQLFFRSIPIIKPMTWTKGTHNVTIKCFTISDFHKWKFYIPIMFF